MVVSLAIANKARRRTETEANNMFVKATSIVISRHINKVAITQAQRRMFTSCVGARTSTD
eukprot:scaffold471504_cov33-Prasinocladus_malaysianus.AAC.1